MCSSGARHGLRLGHVWRLDSSLEGLIAQEAWSLVRLGTVVLTGSLLSVPEVGTPRSLSGRDF